MERQAKANEIIEEYRDSRQQIRSIIAEYEATEHRLFKVMLDKLSTLDREGSYQAPIRSEFAGTLE